MSFGRSPLTQVNRLDRKPPILTTRGSPSTVAVLGGGRYGVFITSRHLRVSDPDSPAAAVEFTILRPPQFGHLENVQTGETSCLSPFVGGVALQCPIPPPGAYIRGRFTQHDVDHRAVVYVIPPVVEVTNDSFQFRLTDPAGNSASSDMWVCRMFL